MMNDENVQMKTKHSVQHSATGSLALAQQMSVEICMTYSVDIS